MTTDINVQIEVIYELVDALSHYSGVRYNVTIDRKLGTAKFSFENEHRNNQRWELASGSLDYIQGYLQARVDNESGG